MDYNFFLENGWLFNYVSWVNSDGTVQDNSLVFFTEKDNIEKIVLHLD